MNRIIKNKLLVLITCLLMSVILMGCQRSSVETKEGSPGHKPLVVCTLFPQYDFARTIFGDEADVRMLLAPGQESHMYDPTPQDMVLISDADLFIYTGDEMEPWAAQLIEAMDRDRVLDLSEYVDLEMELEDEDEYDDGDGHGHDHHHHEHAYDPHYWLNLNNAAHMVEAIAAHAEYLNVNDLEALQSRAKSYEEKIEELDEAFIHLVEASEDKNMVFTGRFAYGYFISHYGLSYETVYHSCSAEADPSIYDMIRVIDYIEENDISLVFQEELSSGKVAQTIANDTGVSVRVFSTGHNVTKEEFDQGITFLDIMTQNYEVLKESFGEKNE